MERLANNTQFAPLGASTRRLQTSDHKGFSVLFSIADFQFSGVTFSLVFQGKVEYFPTLDAEALSTLEMTEIIFSLTQEELEGFFNTRILTIDSEATQSAETVLLTEASLQPSQFPSAMPTRRPSQVPSAKPTQFFFIEPIVVAVSISNAYSEVIVISFVAPLRVTGTPNVAFALD